MPCSSPQVARDLLYMASGTDNKGHGPLPRGLLATWNLSHMRDEYPDVLARSRIRTHSGERPADYKRNALPLQPPGVVLN